MTKSDADYLFKFLFVVIAGPLLLYGGLQWLVAIINFFKGVQ